MQIRIEQALQEDKTALLNALYPGKQPLQTFSNSFLTAFAFSGEDLVGAARVISEGVETALLVDLAGKDTAVKKALIGFLESKLSNRRVMVYGSRADLDLWEEMGYGRCKNAWTYFRKGFPESDFLAPGYRYENETAIPRKNGRPCCTADIRWSPGFSEASAENINELLTRAFWGRPHDIRNTIAAFSASQYVLSAWLDDKLAGVARAVSDGRDYATILNVAVDPEYQGLSIGRALVLKLSRQITEETVVLNTHPGAVGFYNSLHEYRRNRYVFEKHIRSEISKNSSTAFSAAMFTEKGFRFPDE